MYFKDKNDTNIDDEFKQENNILSSILSIIKKYKIIIFITIILLIILLVIFFFPKQTIINYLILDGEGTITLYQNSDYIEPGYKAYNSKDEDLTSQVIVETNLNTSQIGEYEILYTIGNVSEIRKVNIIEKPAVYTYIYLNPINNTTNVYVKIGEEYKEPGYQVFSSVGSDLTNEVKVTGEVDSSKKGTYKLIYSVVDSNNVTVSAYRTVIVMDSEISLTLTDSEYTNKEVIINIFVIDEYFNYVLLPDNTKVTTSTYSYKVTENGKYTFKVYNKKGITKEESIEVKTINKTKPTGSCSGYYKDGTSTINVSSKDDIGISKYVMNGTNYTNNKITINKEIQTATITIYDKAGNTADISCTLEDQNTPVPNPWDSIYTDTNSHTNTINGIRYMLYNQTDSRWSGLKYYDGSTMGDSGCHTTSVAVVSSAYDHNINPETVFRKSNTLNINVLVDNVADDGFNCETIDETNWTDKILTSLSEGKVVIIKVFGRKKGGSSKFTSSQHYMALIDYKDDKIYVGNSASNSTYGRSGWFEKDEVLTSVKQVNVCTPTQNLINKFK